MAELVKVDPTWLPEGWQSNADLEVELYDDGQLRRLARRRSGVLSQSLELEHGAARGRHTDHQGSGGTADWITHTDGFSESFDAWSDNSKPYAQPFEEFVRRAIRSICGR